MVVLPKAPQELLGELGLGNGTFVLPRTTAQLKAPLPAILNGRAPRQAKVGLARTSRKPIIKNTLKTYHRTRAAFGQSQRSQMMRR